MTQPAEPEPRRRRFRRRSRPRPSPDDRRRAIYLLPNLITTGGLVLGLFSMTRAIREDYAVACMAIIGAGVLDVMDGRIARATQSTSRFGTEYDSLADLVAYGVAPAMLVYMIVLEAMGPRGWAIAALFAVCAAMRLARFNAQKDQIARLYNYGLPSTIAGGFVAVSVWFAHGEGLLDDPGVRSLLTIEFVALALLMVTGVPYPSWKNLPTSGRQAFSTLVLMVVVMVAVLLTQVRGFFVIGALYVLSGPALWVYLKATGGSTLEPAPQVQQAGE